MTIGRLFRRARKIVGMTQVQVAAEAGWARENISHLERGSQKNPSIDTIRRYAAAIGWTADRILALEHVPESEDIYPDTKMVQVWKGGQWQTVKA
jgi:transcriptional regulator with XRE-family HTH domain